MRIVILGGGPAGLYAGLLIKKANPAHTITVVERNPANVTYGWGVVFSDRTLASFQNADYKTYEQITTNFVIWDAIDVYYRGETIRCGGHVIASISRKLLLQILQARCTELGVELQFSREITDLAELGDYDLLIAADGVNSLVRRAYEDAFKPSVEFGRAKYIWLGADKVLDAFTFIFHETEHGLFQVHAYPFNGATSTFIVECEEAVWQRASLDQADEAASLAFCQRLLNKDLHGAPLLSNNAKWINFPTLKTQHWHIALHNPQSAIRNPQLVLLGDAAHTAHFSIGSGTKLAMEDAIALARALEQHTDLAAALDEYEIERRPVVEIFQRAAQESRIYFETLKRYLVLPPMQFAFQLLARSGRISYDDLRLRDSRFGDGVDRWFAGQVHNAESKKENTDHAPLATRHSPLVAPSPMLTPFHIGGLTIANRVVLAPLLECPAQEGTPGEEYGALLARRAADGAGLVLTQPVAVTADGRITPGDAGLYEEEHGAAWARIVETVHAAGGAKIVVQLNHAGRRGATRPRGEGLDRPLRTGGWSLLAPSPLPYTPAGPAPQAMTRADMDRVRVAFGRAAAQARAAGVDVLLLHMAHGYLLASFLSPLTNRREDAFGGDLAGRLRFPLEVFYVVRAAWPEDRPLGVTLNVTDGVRDGFDVKDAVAVARTLRQHGCDLVLVEGGQTTPEGEPPYGRGFLTPLSNRLRNEAGLPTLVGGYLTTSNEINTILAAGRADLCILEPPHLDAGWWDTPVR